MDIAKILAEHELWIDSAGKEGKRANLGKANMNIDEWDEKCKNARKLRDEQLLKVQCVFEALKTDRESMVVANATRMQNGEAPAYGEVAFNKLAKQFQFLVENYLSGDLLK
jgi:hypothetical protein